MRSLHYDAPYATILINPRSEWSRIASIGRGRLRQARSIEVDWQKFTPEEYIFTHCSIVSSVEAEENGYHIKPVCSELVNNNGNSWTNEILIANFRSFVGAQNYVEHLQIPALSKGRILDAVLRPYIHSDKAGDKSNVYMCDILVATSRRHTELVDDIVSGKMNTLSMGCSANFVTCSQCGVVLQDEDPDCIHLSKKLRGYFTDDNGVKRIVSEICGRCIRVDGKLVGDPESVDFIEASWVENPAFLGAVVNHFVSDLGREATRILACSDMDLEAAVYSMMRMRVADSRGMMAMRVAASELHRRRLEVIANRIARAKWL